MNKKVDNAVQANRIRNRAKAAGLDASLAYWNVSAAALAELTGGCGPGKLGDALIPDKIFGLDLTPACQVHDFDYSPMSEIPRALADARFFANMRRLMRKQLKVGFWQNIKQRFAICKYFDAVEDHGESSKK